MQATSDIRVTSMKPITSPKELLTKLPASPESLKTVLESRAVLAKILRGEDKRLLVIVGPCSIHDHNAAIAYARKLKVLADKISDKIYIVMRVYFEKPRTKLGWKGLILDPRLDGSHDIQQGLIAAREILIEITKLGVPAGTEALDPIVPQYIDDLISWAAIGARTTESQTHREMASGLSVPVGFKNGTDGSVDTAVNAMVSAQAPHSFIGIDADGRTCIVNTSGNDLGHVILRGGKNGPNYYREKVEAANALLRASGMPERLIIDCSHENSNKDYKKQKWVLEEVLQHRRRGFSSVIGCMLESNLEEGRQDLGSDPSQLRYGVSITDSCISWEETEKLLLQAYSEET